MPEVIYVDRLKDWGPTIRFVAILAFIAIVGFIIYQVWKGRKVETLETPKVTLTKKEEPKQDLQAEILRRLGEIELRFAQPQEPPAEVPAAEVPAQTQAQARSEAQVSPASNWSDPSWARFREVWINCPVRVFNPAEYQTSATWFNEKMDDAAFRKFMNACLQREVHVPKRQWPPETPTTQTASRQFRSGVDRLFEWHCANPQDRTTCSHRQVR